MLGTALILVSYGDEQDQIAWRLYVKALDALELDAAPDIEWPAKRDA